MTLPTQEINSFGQYLLKWRGYSFWAFDAKLYLQLFVTYSLMRTKNLNPLSANFQNKIKLFTTKNCSLHFQGLYCH